VTGLDNSCFAYVGTNQADNVPGGYQSLPVSVSVHIVLESCQFLL